MVTVDGKVASTRRIEKLLRKLKLPEVELSTSYRDPSFRLGKKVIITVKDASVAYLPCPLEMKEVLLEMAPEIYYQTDHYKGWPGLLLRLDAIGDEELGLRLEDSWRRAAPKALAATRHSS
jgi:hypothetical protein